MVSLISLFIISCHPHKSPNSRHYYPLLQMGKLEFKDLVQSIDGESIYVRET